MEKTPPDIGRFIEEYPRPWEIEQSRGCRWIATYTLFDEEDLANYEAAREFFLAKKVKPEDIITEAVRVDDEVGVAMFVVVPKTSIE